MTTTIRIGIIGAGMAGQAHAFGYRNAMMAGDLGDVDVQLHTIADPNLGLAQSVAKRYGFANAVADIDAFLANPEIDAVSVALPNHLHAQILPKVIASGKHLFAEKPIGRTREEAAWLAGLAEASSAVTGVGFSFRRLPGLAALAQAVQGGAIGQVHTVRAWYNADYAADPAGALSWRYSQELSGGGALLDIGAHAIDAAQFVVGPVTRVLNSTLRTVITERPKPAAGAIGHGAATTEERGPVTNDDVALLTVEFDGGAVGQITLSRISSGIPNSLGVEAFGSEGHALFDSISAGEFHLFQNGVATSATNGPRRIFTGPEHPYFNDVAAMPGAGVGTGYAEAFVAEIQEFLRCVRDGSPMDTDFNTAVKMMRVVGAALDSAASNAVIDINTHQQA
ncbi:Gfo/Idh/MocA family protein [Arthrobacter sp. M4]|uniref:Gfo/Idh/MocA family protein n=1 Tax=Arthrobacter sp. M4 TaxID=218160 RepID=UPI001CDBD438|nr:Gfo/Idh/MocA family oxidoreductase [Arthrobacter sp. M4]MCA4134800.1 Gfo/Idh/MocA family oxidoreductase [Arthrobacter sp. M4]